MALNILDLIFRAAFFFVLFDWVRVRMRQLPYQIAVALIIKVDTFVFFFFGARWLGPLPSPIAVAPILLTTSCFFFALALRFRYAHSYAFHSLVAIFRPFYRVFLPLRHLSGKSFLFAMAADYQMNENIFFLFFFYWRKWMQPVRPVCDRERVLLLKPKNK